MNKATIAAIALVAEVAAAAYSTRSAMTALAVICVLLVPFVFAAALPGHVGTAAVVAFAVWSLALAAAGDAEGSAAFPSWLATAFSRCAVVALIAGIVWVWRRVTANSSAAKTEELDVTRYIVGEPD